LVGGVRKKVGGVNPLRGVEKSLGTTVTWPEGPLRGGVFGERQHSGPRPIS